MVLGTFLTLRLQQAWLERDLSMAEAVESRARAVRRGDGRGLAPRWSSACCSTASIACASAWPRWRSAAVAYLLCGFVDDPTQATLLMAAVAVLLGVGQIAAIIAGQTLLGQEAPRDVRGAVFGLAGMCASAGILFTNGIGGWLYDIGVERRAVLPAGGRELRDLPVRLRLCAARAASRPR